LRALAYFFQDLHFVVKMTIIYWKNHEMEEEVDLVCLVHYLIVWVAVESASVAAFFAVVDLRL
jgi:hypothetical protein